MQSKVSRLQRRRAGARPVTGRAALLAASLLLSGCATFTTMHGPSPGTPERRPLPVAGTALFDWKGQVHCHSHWSHDSRGTIAEIAAAAHEAQFDFLVMTDHQTDDSIAQGTRGLVGDTLFVVGAELNTNRGDVLAFPLTRPLRRVFDIRAFVAEAAAQGAIVFFAHAEEPHAWDTPGIAGVEIVNLHAGARAASPVAMILSALFLPAHVVMGLCCRRDAGILAHWDEQLQQRHPLAPVGGGDAHANIRLYGPLGGTIGSYREVFLTLTTHVLAPAMDEAALVAAFRLGRSYVVFDAQRDGTGFDFRATSGVEVFTMGDTVTAGPGLRLGVHLPVPAHVRLLRDGQEVATADATELQLAAPAPGVYRVEAELTCGTPWLLSSTIRVVAAP